MNTLIARFWWRQRIEEKKVHWVSWQKMTQIKQEGGMGFKDLQTFNIALLMKMAWRILKNPDLLCAKVLKGLYFPESEFLDARKGPRASWLWSGLLEGRGKMREGIFWQVGDGGQIKVWEDLWIPGSKGKRLQMIDDSALLKDLRVCNLINRSTWTWDLSCINGRISQEDKVAIESIELLPSNKEDRLVWPYERMGSLSVRSAYAFLRENQTSVSRDKPSSSHQTNKAVWKGIWKIHCLPKIKHFLWRVLTKSIAVNAEMKRRGITGSSTCCFCHREETTEHSFLLCPWTSYVWFESLNLRIDVQSVTTFDRWFEGMLYQNTKEKDLKEQLLTKIAFTLWYIWKGRNEAIFRHEEPNVTKTVHQLKQALAEWCLLKKNLKSKPRSATMCGSCVTWSPPPAGYIKVNCDASHDPATDVIGMGGVVRNSEGALIGGFGKKGNGSSVAIAEVRALLEGLHTAARLGGKIILETDAESVFHAMTAEEDSMDWHLRPFVHEIRHARRSCTDVRISLVRRKANECANLVAQWYRKEMAPSEWVVSPPSSLLRLLVRDLEICTKMPGNTSSSGDVSLDSALDAG